MKLTKQLEKELRQVYEAFWESLLGVNMRRFNSFLADDFKQIGTTQAEFFFNRKEAAKFLKATEEQVVGNIELRNRVIKVEPVDKLILITEQSDAYVKIDDVWTFYAKTRATSLLQKKGKDWKFIQQHISFPDNRTEEGETIALEKIAKENLELRDAVKRRTEELENKNRELEIETALERVRAVAMAMRKPQELTAVSEIIFTELRSLGFDDIRNTEIIINKDERHTITSYYYSDYGVTGTIDVDTTTHPTVKNWMEELKKTSDSFVAVHISEKEMKEWRKYRESLGYLPDLKLNKIKTVEYYSYSVGPGAISVSSFKPITDKQLKTLERFKNVFGLAYRRYADVAKAEAQAREATIETSLEKVRGRAMAMHKSDELLEAAALLYNELFKLGIPTLTSGYVLMDEEEKIGWNYVINPADGTILPKPAGIPHTETEVMRSITSSWKKQESFHVRELDPQATIEHHRHLAENSIDFPISVEEFLSVTPERLVFYTFNFKQGYLLITGGGLLTADQVEMLVRFAKVFEMTYRRFLDLKQAEAQAREAQIELGLERVRARAMAMQKSDELSELVDTVFKELTKLDFALTWCIINIIDESSMSNTVWAANPDIDKAPESYHMLFEDYPFHHAMMKGWKERQTKYVYTLEGSEKKIYDEYLFNETEFRKVPEAAQAASRAMEKYVVTFSFSNFGGLQTVGDVPLSDANLDILSRFGKVFDLTYTRFNDLKQAEAQAREAQIEFALERVRSRTMAMQKSDELAETAAIVFKQLIGLGVEPNRLYIGIIKDESGDIEAWTTDEEGSKVNRMFMMSSKRNASVQKMYNGWKESKKSLVIDMQGKELSDYIHYLSEELHAPFTKGLTQHRRVQTIAYFSKGFIGIASPDEQPETTFNLLERFAAVFNLTYTRFLDLKKAEAQAREAQIETALERVRARTMAMHRSEELAEAAAVLFKQFVELGNEPDRFSIGIIDEETNTTDVWATDQTGSKINVRFRCDNYANSTMTRMTNGWKAKEISTVIDLHGEELKNWLNYVRHVLNMPVSEEQVYGRRLHHLSFFTQGWLNFTTHEPLSDDARSLLDRFASVFNLTFRRFLDLQKAEAQAKEAQIEASLERVRARTMAMHNSEDVTSATETLFEELSKLGIVNLRCGIANIHHSRTFDVFGVTHLTGDNTMSGFDFFGMDEHPTWQRWFESWTNKEEVFIAYLAGQEKEEYFNNINDHLHYLPQKIIDFPDSFFQAYYFEQGSVWVYSLLQHNEPEKEIMKRFASGFSLTFRRYQDLKQAEAQARDAQIETALEKVRSRSLAMHKSDELQEVVNTVFERLQELNIETDSTNIAIFKEGTRDYDYWIASHTQKRSASFHMPYIDLSLTRDIIAARETGTDYSAAAYSFEVKNEWFDYAFKNTDFKFLSEERKQFIMSAPAIMVAIAFSKHTGVQVNRYSGKLLSEGEAEILKRFSKVFEQAYIRFLDLEKAEAQAREAQIEASLERVRSKTMAMHNSNDVGETVAAMFAEFVQLGIYTNRCGILIFDDNDSAEVWTAKSDAEGKATLIIGKLDLKIYDMLSSAYKAWKDKKPIYQYELHGDDIVRHYEAINRSEYYPVKFDMSSLPQKEFHSDFFFPEGAVFAFTGEPIAEEHSKIFKRFAGVFGQTYRRYLDLQKAEAQAREAQIETGLERVRARTMAMHSSEDVSAATATMFTELEKLGIENFRGGIAILLTNRTQEVWSVNNLPEGKIVKAVGTFNIDDHSFWQNMYKEWENKKEFLHYFLAGKEKEDYVKILNTAQNYLPHSIQQFPDVHFQVYFFGEGGVWTNSLQPHSEEDKQVMKKFASVFSLTFRRYQDLKKAEAQAREATIEAALEKVRGKAMAMHNSNDLTATASLVFTELRKLGINPMRCGVGLLTKESRKVTLYAATSSDEGDSLSLMGWVMLEGQPVLAEIYDSWFRGEDYYPVMKGELLKSYYEKIKSGFVVPTAQSGYEQYGYFLAFSEGTFYGWSEKPFTETEIRILNRFKNIIDLTFRRYIELKKSEANAREAVKQAALDRVRAEIASMRTVSDLEKITPLIWNELNILGIPFIRCGVFIMDEKQQLIHTFLSTPDGKAIAAFHLPYTTPGSIQQVLGNWKIKKKYIDHWDEGEFTQFADILVEQGALASAEQYLKTIPQGGFHLHFLPFLQGMLYVGNTNQLNNDEIELIQHVADAFSTAYARYEDFNKLEVAKQQVENTLTDLKQAQQQLVQSEKMASLGELTAGIAHEIQNPLNFVNNFSEVSKELLNEMKTELETGNTEDAKDIADDVIQNLEKINHHGKRADAIVKSMLQHSRSSSGKKEPTDINALADEYLRLAFHGLRAKDKSFNAKFETEFDNSIEKINIIPQDIGRVILNLINNAFYAVTEKKKLLKDGYEPIVTVSTKTVKPPSGGLGVWISVKDNGNGIPQKVFDKIFQPFFTTKPTGQGTGLGLSLSYDIITKGHGGELKVETKEGEGSEFIIQIPVSKTAES